MKSKKTNSLKLTSGMSLKTKQKNWHKIAYFVNKTKRKNEKKTQKKPSP